MFDKSCYHSQQEYFGFALVGRLVVCKRAGCCTGWVGLGQDCAQVGWDKHSRVGTSWDKGQDPAPDLLSSPNTADGYVRLSKSLHTFNLSADNSGTQDLQ